LATSATLLSTTATTAFVTAPALLAAALRTAALFPASLLPALVVLVLLLVLRLALGKDDRRFTHRLRPPHAERRGREGDGAKNKNSVFCTDHGRFLHL
jgi:hypothetical protein